MKKTIISSSVCLVIGIIIGIGGLYLWQSKSLSEFNNSVVITGDNDKIDHEKISNKKDHIEITTVAKKPGKIKTVIKKESFCPKIYKNSLSFIFGVGIIDLKPVVSYELQYKRQLIPRVHMLTGVQLDFINGNMYYGTMIKLGAGVNF